LQKSAGDAEFAQELAFGFGTPEACRISKYIAVTKIADTCIWSEMALYTDIGCIIEVVICTGACII